jgi:hypothetical protein
MIHGGFAGHGLNHGVKVDAGTLRRHCGDCGFEWAPDEDPVTGCEKKCPGGPARNTQKCSTPDVPRATTATSPAIQPIKSWPPQCAPRCAP